MFLNGMGEKGKFYNFSTETQMPKFAYEELQLQTSHRRIATYTHRFSYRMQGNTLLMLMLRVHFSERTEGLPWGLASSVRSLQHQH